jgi:hypothetical protein
MCKCGYEINQTYSYCRNCGKPREEAEEEVKKKDIEEQEQDYQENLKRKEDV